MCAPCILQGILIHCICAVLNFSFFVTRVSFTAFIGLCKNKAAFPFSIEKRSGYLRAIERRYMVSSPVNDTVSSRGTLSLTLYLR